MTRSLLYAARSVFRVKRTSAPLRQGWRIYITIHCFDKGGPKARLQTETHIKDKIWN